MNDICFVSLPAYGYFNSDKYQETGGGGAKRQIYLISKHLAKKHNVGVVVGDYDQPKYEEYEEVSLYRSYTPNKSSEFEAFFSLYKAMIEADSRIYVYRGNPRKAAIVAVIARLLGKEWVYHIASDEDIGRYYDKCSPVTKKIFKNRLLSSKEVIAQTNYQKQKIMGRFGVEATVVPNGYPPIDSVIENRQQYFLWVGRFDEEQKRPHLVLKIAEQLSNTQFRVIGVPNGTNYSDKIVTQCKQLNNISYLESVPPDEIHKHYSNAIALINTSAYEGFPNTFLEAWRYGVPVISMSVNIDRYFDAEIYDGFCEKKLANSLNKIEHLENIDRENSIKLESEIKNHFEKEYSIKNVVERYESVI